MKTLKETSVGETVKVVKHQRFRLRLKEESWIWESPKVLTYSCAKLLRWATVEVTVRGYELSLRKADAEM